MASNNRAKRKIKKEVKSFSKRLSLGAVALMLLFVVIGAVGGIFVEKLITKNDCFVLNGDKEVIVDLNSEFSYVDEGCKVVSFGKDISNKIAIKTNMDKNSDGSYALDTSVVGEYYIIYTVNDVKYGNIQRVRIFYVGGKNE